MLVSTDKAVKPATVMGASKALAEFAIEEMPRASRARATRACASATCSARRARVVPIFRRQIERGGPVTVTHERMTRYFMTIPEAVQLIIRAGDARRAAARSSCSRWASR